VGDDGSASEWRGTERGCPTFYLLHVMLGSEQEAVGGGVDVGGKVRW
jgi:hypothetical protein